MDQGQADFWKNGPKEPVACHVPLAAYSSHLSQFTTRPPQCRSHNFRLSRVLLPHHPITDEPPPYWLPQSSSYKTTTTWPSSLSTDREFHRAPGVQTSHKPHPLRFSFCTLKMSGLSLAVAPHSDPAAGASPPSLARTAKTQSVMGGVMGSLRVIELQLVAFIMVFSASGLVPLLDLIFPAFATIYTIILSRLAFRSPKSPYRGSREIFHGSRLFQAYVVLGTTVGLFLPLAYVLGGFARSDDHAVRSATPHLFLLSCQILTENVISGLSLFSPPVRVIVPLLYTARRIFVIVDWNYDVWMNKTVPVVAPMKDVAWLWFGRGLAIANLVYFTVNLFGFLIPRFLPRAFERYFKECDEVYAKMAEDKPAGAEIAAASKPDDMKKVE